MLDADHKDSLTDPAAVVAGQRYPFSFPLLPADYTFPAGHRIGVVIVGSYRDYGTSTDTGTPAQITLSEQASRVTLPVVGGGTTLRSAGLAAGETTTTALAQDSPQTDGGQAVTLTATVSANDAAMRPAALAGFAREALLQRDYDGFTALNTPTGSVQFKDGGQDLGAPVPLANGVAQMTTTALGGGTQGLTAVYLGDGGFDGSTSAAVSHVVHPLLTVSGTVPATLALTLGTPATFGAFAPGVARTYTAATTADVVSTAGDAALSASDPGHLANGAFTLAQPLQVDISPASWSEPVSHATSAITFTQAIGANDPLRTGTYATTLTFTLSTTTP